MIGALSFLSNLAIPREVWFALLTAAVVVGLKIHWEARGRRDAERDAWERELAAERAAERSRRTLEKEYERARNNRPGTHGALLERLRNFGL